MPLLARVVVSRCFSPLLLILLYTVNLLSANSYAWVLVDPLAHFSTANVPAFRAVASSHFSCLPVLQRGECVRTCFLLVGALSSGVSAAGGALRLSVIPTAPSRSSGRCGSFALSGPGRGRRLRQASDLAPFARISFPRKRKRFAQPS